MEYYCYDGAPKSCYFNNIVNEIYLGAGAELNHYKFQNEACKAAHIAFNAVRIKRNGVYNGFCLQKGADLGRNETRVQLLEEEAKAEVNAAYLMNGWATLDTTTDIEHLAEKTYSSQLIKGVVGGEAKGVFQGKIRIAPNAQKTEGQAAAQALLLSDIRGNRRQARTGNLRRRRQMFARRGQRRAGSGTAVLSPLARHRRRRGAADTD